jgi:3-phenylpropionate/trans-cinnamate dioxygenase ferredoxin reductase subunit
VTQPQRVVIVGAGHAGFNVAQSLSDDGFEGSIVLLSAEDHLPYERPPLSKAYLYGNAELSSLAFRQADFYPHRSIELRTGARVTSLDRDAREVMLSTGDTISYDHLVLATGSHARTLPIPGMDLANVFTVRSLDDSEALRAALPLAKSVVVVGGGFIGLEIASTARALGARVDVIESLPRLMARVVSEPVANFFLTEHRAKGTSVHLSSGVTHFSGTGGRVSSVSTIDGLELPADLVVVGVGSTPSIELATAAGLEVTDAVVVDGHLLTSDPSISAIGDCVRFPLPNREGLFRLESVQNAVDQARCVARRLTGHEEPYQAVPWFWTEQAGHRLQMAGWLEDHDEAVIRPGQNPTRFSAFLLKAGNLVGAESVNAPADHIAVRRLLAAGGTISSEHLADPQWDVRAHVTSELKARSAT